jgi:hypothetical protein
LDAGPSLRAALAVVDCGVRELKGIALPEHVYQVAPKRLATRSFAPPPNKAAADSAAAIAEGSAAAAVAAAAAAAATKRAAAEKAQAAAAAEASENARASFEYPPEPQPNPSVPVRKRFDVFLCHLDSDAGDLCRQLHGLLSQKGYKVCHPSCSGGKLHFYSGRGSGQPNGENDGAAALGEGDDDDDEDEDDHLEPVRASHCLVFVLSSHVFDPVAAGCWAELRAAFDGGLQLLPLRQEGANWGGKPLPDPLAPYVPLRQIDGRGGRFQVPPLLRALLAAPKVTREG